MNSRVRDYSLPSGLSCFSLGRTSEVSIVLARGVPVKRICEMLGHSTMTPTPDTNSHLITAMHGDAADAIDALFTA